MMAVTRRSVLFWVVAACVTAAGCQGSGGGGGGKREPETAEGRPQAVPQGARQVSENSQGRLVHRPQRDGTIWVYDATDKRIVYTGKAAAYSNVVIDPSADAVTVNDQQVQHRPQLQERHTYRLYFQPQ